MPINFLNLAVLLVSLLTGLTVEGIKKLLSSTEVKYSTNILAVIVSIVLSASVCISYLILTDTAFTLKIAVEIIIFIYVGFLVSTVGYDKVMQTLTQVKESKDE